MKRLFATVLLVLGLAGCSTGFVYTNLDWLVHWYLDDYVNLDRQQKKLFDQHMNEWLDWHRNEELVSYRAHLVRLKQAVEQGPMTQTQWLAEFEQGRAHWQRLLDHLAPELATLALTLEDKQVESIFTEVEDKNREREEDRADQDESERLQERHENLVEDLEQWAGRLNEQQKELVGEYAGQFRSNFNNWIIYRRAWQARAKEMLLEKQDSEQWKASFAQLLSEPERYQSPEFKRISAYNNALYAKMLEALQPSLSDKQRRHVSRELQELIDDLTDLIGDD
ncbi:DUF6279 family lipoprotein [Bowmanella dokdonensis]|uniref:Lipoprotein n=1 Tax=Bowmanella dokdonensis TaxID=751969 RepID=A0A939IQE9_9ALTE|nr:DUF6279 family lipoprotein [Bowmanella dokdonensis]MBN7824522.1 hypothetical protein [Bowmanella dokdonensis]